MSKYTPSKSMQKTIPWRRFRGSASERLWARVDKSNPNGCWIWQGACNSKGYGQINSGECNLYTHRLSWEFEHGPIPAGALILHKCDRNYPVGDITYRRCCNPAHLFLGTAKDNTEDMLSKGREARGERMNSAKLAEPEVLEIRELFATGNFTKSELGRRYNVTKGIIRGIVNGKGWSHLPLPEHGFKGQHRPPSKVTESQVREIRAASANGVSYKALAAIYGVSDHQISMIVRRKNWAHVP